MKKYLMALALGIGISVVGNAQSNDPAAKSILDGVSAKFKTYKAVQANFTLAIEDAKGKTQGTKKGTLYYKGSKYRVSIPGTEIFSDGKTNWSYDKTANEVTISKTDASGTALTPQKLFTNFYDKDFLYKLNGEKKVGAKTVQEIELTPTDKSKPFFKILLTVDKASKTIVSTKVMQKDGTKLTYAVSNLNGNANIADSQFVFDKSKYPGVEEVDLR